MFGWGKVIDISAFREIIGDDRAALESIVDVFEQQANTTLRDLNTAISQNNNFVFDRATHDLRIIGRHVASQKIVSYSHALQEWGRDGQRDNAEAKLKGAQKLLDQALKELRGLQKSWKSV